MYFYLPNDFFVGLKRVILSTLLWLQLNVTIKGFWLTRTDYLPNHPFVDLNSNRIFGYLLTAGKYTSLILSCLTSWNYLPY